MSLATVVEAATDALVTALLAVPGVVNVQEGEPHARDWAAWFAPFRESDQTVQGWLVDPEVTDEPAEAPRTDHVVIRWLIVGFRSVTVADAAASRATFRAAVMGIMDALRFGTLAGTVEFTDPVESRLDGGALVEDRELGGVSCHVCELGVTTHSWLAV